MQLPGRAAVEGMLAAPRNEAGVISQKLHRIAAAGVGCALLHDILAARLADLARIGAASTDRSTGCARHPGRDHRPATSCRRKSPAGSRHPGSHAPATPNRNGFHRARCVRCRHRQRPWRPSPSHQSTSHTAPFHWPDRERVRRSGAFQQEMKTRSWPAAFMTNWRVRFPTPPLPPALGQNCCGILSGSRPQRLHQHVRDIGDRLPVPLHACQNQCSLQR